MRLFQQGLKKIVQRDLKIKSAQKYFQELTLSNDDKQIILNSTASQLISYLQQLKYTSLQILLTYYAQAVTVGYDLELIADIDIENAVLECKKCDQMRIQKTNEEEIKGKLLFGLPISVKDNFQLKGTDSTGGCANNTFMPDKEDGLVIQILKQHGAIPFIKSNIPQFLMINESVSFWGRAKNPWNVDRTTSGSSGGEAGLVAAQCSPFGAGTDIGGSIRHPCLYCGVYGLKPTSMRITYKGIQPPFKQVYKYAGNQFIRSTVGPISRSVDDLELFMRVFCDENTQHNVMFQQDNKVVPLKWQHDKYVNKGEKQKLYKIGYILTDPYFPVSPANKRAVEEAVIALKTCGHELVPLTFPNMERMVECYFGILSAEGKMRSYYAAAQGEQFIKEYSTLKMVALMPNYMRNVLSFLYRHILGESRIARLILIGKEKKSHELFAFSRMQQELRDEFHQKLFLEKGISALVTPGLALPAVKHGQSQDLVINCCYNFIINLIDFPAGSVPVTLVKAHEQTYSDGHNDRITKKAKECMRESEGLPVGVQVVALPFQDELCLSIMKQLEDKIQFKLLDLFSQGQQLK